MEAGPTMLPWRCPDMATNESNWIEFNQRYLSAAIAQVRDCLERHATRSKDGQLPHSELSPDPSEIVTKSTEPLPALEILTQSFGLSIFERSILLLSAGIELDSSLAGLCAAAQGSSARNYPTFSLALAALPAPHWSALNPAAPLRRWRLIEISTQAGTSLTSSPLGIDERILHFLTGLQHLDERLTGLLRAVHTGEDIAASHAAQARLIAATWNKAQRELPVINLCGEDEITKRAVAAAGCAETRFGLYALAADQIPINAQEVEGLIRLWERESVLTSSAIYIDTEGVDANDAKAMAQLSRFANRVQGPVILSSKDRWRPLSRGLKTLEIGKPTAQEQQSAWTDLLSAANVHINGHVPNLVAQFNLNFAGIR